jgi:leucyl aminopeptidase
MRYLLSLLPLLPLYIGSVTAAPQQLTFAGPEVVHEAHSSILSAIDAYPDPVDALLSLRPDLALSLSTPRLLDVAGQDGAVWMTEGDKLRLKREGRFFIDITGRPDAVDAQSLAGSKASEQLLPWPTCRLTVDMPELTQQRFVKPCFEDVSTKEMHRVLKHMTSFYNRYYHSTNGEKSARWLHDHISEVSPLISY